MIELSVALVLIGLMAWDIARRVLKPVDSKRMNQLEANHQELAVDIMAARDEVAKTDKVVENLALDWQQKFMQLEAALPKLEKDVLAKMGGTIAQLPNRGYNR